MGVPEEYLLFVVIPTLLRMKIGRGITGSLEVHYLSNRDENIYFGIRS